MTPRLLPFRGAERFLHQRPIAEMLLGVAAQHAFQIAEARRHVLRPPTEPSEADTPEQIEREAKRELDMVPEQLSLFSVLSSVATGMNLHAFTEEGLTLFDDEPEVPEPEAQVLDELALDLPDIPTDAGYMMPGRKSIAEIKEELRLKNMDIAKRLVDVTGWSHSRVQAELNRLSGITSVGSATNAQLERRLRHGETWLRRR